MWPDKIGPFGFYNWFKDDWLVSPRAVKAFLLAALLVLGTIPIFLGWIDPAKVPSWQRPLWGIEGVFGALSIFFLWISMWRYWIRLDNSSRSEKLISFMLLLVGMFYGSVIYYFFVYRSQIATGSWTKPANFSREEKNEGSNRNLQKLFLTGIFSLFGLALAFGLLLPILFKRVLLPNDDSSYEVLLELGLSVSVFSFLVFLVTMLFRLGTNAHPLWRIQRVVSVGVGFVLGFALVFAFLVPSLLSRLLPPQYEDNYEIFLGLGLSAGAVVVFIYAVTKIVRKLMNSSRRAQTDVGPRWELQKIWYVGGLSLFGFMLIGLLFNILLRKFLPRFVYVSSIFMVIFLVFSVVGIISLFVYLIVEVFRLGMKTRR